MVMLLTVAGITASQSQLAKPAVEISAGQQNFPLAQAEQKANRTALLLKQEDLEYQIKLHITKSDEIDKAYTGIEKYCSGAEKDLILEQLRKALGKNFLECASVQDALTQVRNQLKIMQE